MSLTYEWRMDYNYYRENLISGCFYMNWKRVLALSFSFLVVFSLTSCKIKRDDSADESTTVAESNINENITQNALNPETIIYNTTEYFVQNSSQQQVTETTIGTTQAEIITTEPFDDPANWSIERIVEEYKKAATISNGNAKSTMQITLNDISVNNGEYDKAMSLVKPIIAKFIESSSTENTGITGGFQNLVPQDVSSAKAYKSGDDTVIEMVMVEQTSGPKEDANSGSVGHAITAVGDISVVIKDLADMGLPLELSEEDTKIYYTNPSVRVVINDKGEIVSGTWSYTVEISMNNFKAFGQNVDRASITMDNTITV